MDMIRVTVPSRLHFGLLALPAQGVAHWANSEGQPTLPVRHFGGVGLMIEHPGVQVRIRPSTSWSAEGPSAQRALEAAQRFMSTLPNNESWRAFNIVVEQCAPEHAGLGTGTQLALAVAKGLSLALGHADWNARLLANRTDRGLRSSLGIHGFEHGGLLVEGGKGKRTDIAPLLMRCAFPEDWQVLLILPAGLQGVHGTSEKDAFAHLAGDAHHLQQTDALCRLVLLGLLPALAERDLLAFGEALYDFNCRVGELFAPWQGAVYSHPQTAEVIAWLRQQGIRGVGQSSWGPAVFAIEHAELLQYVRELLLKRWPLQPEEAILCRAANHGAKHA